jgi:hypothetical protein
MGLPRWLFPVEDVKNGRTSTIALWFYNGKPAEQPTPYHAWIMPLLSWGLFVAAMLATLGAVARIVIEQWTANERLPFPLVQVHSALIEPPAKGRGLNRIFSSPLLWIGLLGVLAIHMLSCLNAYFPRNCPKIPLQFDLTSILSEEPFMYLRPKLKKATLSFTVVGVTYFIRSRAAFSLWATYIIVNLVDMQAGMRQQEMPADAWADQHLGACIAFVIAILWIGRHHWMRVLRDAFGRSEPAERRYAGAFWVATIGVFVMLGWLIVLGVHWWMAMAIVLFIVVAHLIVARVVAETGLPFYRTTINTSQLYTLAPTKWFTARDIFFAAVYNVLGPLTTRDGLTTFATNGLGVCRNAGVTERSRGRVGGVMAWTLIAGFVIATVVALHCEYSYPTPASQEASPVRNFFGAEWVPRRDIAVELDDHARGRFAPKQHNPGLQMGIGFCTTVGLEIASWEFANWPFLPVGYVTAGHGAFVENAWFSIFIGWCAQVLIVRFGGASLFQKARPFFVGIIFGECLAAGIWLIVNAIIVFNGGEGQAVKFLL